MELPTFRLASVTRATTYRLTVDKPLGGWACCTVNDATGELTIQSDWGSWSHRWNVTALGGGQTLTEFISRDTSYDYLAHKLMSDDQARCFSPDRTLEHLRERLRERRREWKTGWRPRGYKWSHERSHWDTEAHWDLDKDTANRLWDEDFPALVRDCDSYSTQREAVHAFVEGFYRIEGFSLICDEPWDLVCTEDSHTYLILRDAILPALTLACRGPEITAAAEAHA